MDPAQLAVRLALARGSVQELADFIVNLDSDAVGELHPAVRVLVLRELGTLQHDVRLLSEHLLSILPRPSAEKNPVE